MMDTSIKSRRPRILKGQLVASTNIKKVSCIKVLYIEHRYRDLSFRRVKQVVIHMDNDDVN